MKNEKSKFITNKEFKKWMEGQNGLSAFSNISERVFEPVPDFIGKEAIAKVSRNKILQKIKSENDSIDPEDLVDDFMENGGLILSIKGKNLYIESSSGSFYLPRFCVKVDI